MGASTRDQLIKKQMEKQMKLLKKKAKVKRSDLKLIKFNLILFVASLIALLIGILVVYYLFIGNSGVYAYARVLDTGNFDPNSKKYLYFVGSQFGAVLIGLGIFLLMSAMISFSNDYEVAKKEAIDRLIEFEKQKVAKQEIGAINIFDALAINMKKVRV